MNSLSPAAQKIIADYLALPFKSGPVQCPYYNNDRLKLRAGLRVLVGKGSPKDILDEAMILSLHEKIDLHKLTPEAIKKFLVEHRIGVDCSGFIYYVLDAELKAKNQGGLAQWLKFPKIKNPLRKILTKLRPAENTSVAVLAHDKNSVRVNLTDARPGDFITMQNPDNKSYVAHVALLEQVEKPGPSLVLHYIHSIPWSADGRFGHGVRRGQISIKNPAQSLAEQVWTENNVSDEQNETYTKRVRLASVLDLRRLKIMA